MSLVLIRTGPEREDVYQDGECFGYIVEMFEGWPIKEIWGVACPNGCPIQAAASREEAVNMVVEKGQPRHSAVERILEEFMEALQQHLRKH